MNREQKLEEIIYKAICYIEGDRNTEEVDVHKLYLILTKIDDLEDGQKDVEIQTYEYERLNK